MKTDEAKLNAAIKANKISGLYFFYGKEVYLVKTYSDRIIGKVLDPNDIDFNLVKFEGIPDNERLYDAVNGLPVFAEKKVVIMNDFNAEKTEADSLTAVTGILSDIPETTVVIINVTGFELDVKKAKTKKLLSLAEKQGTVCEFDLLPQSKTTELIIKKAARAGVLISRENAIRLSEMTLRNLTLISAETEKLCSCVGKGGEITAEIIKALVPKQLDNSVFDLTAALTRGDVVKTFELLNELFYEGYQPVVIVASIGGVFADFYRVKLGKAAGKSNERIAEDFSYAKNRVWLIGKTASVINGIGISYIKEGLELLCEADFKLKSSPVDSRFITEKVIAELLSKKRRTNAYD